MTFRRLAALAALAIGAGQLPAPAAQARLWLDNGASLNGANLNGVGLNGMRLNGTSFNGAGEGGVEARRPGAASSSSPADAGRLRLRAVRLAGDGR